MSTRTFALELGRPPTANQDNNLHYRKRAAIRKVWREATATTARALHLEPMGRIALTVQARYHALPLTDTDACHPAVKPVLDGLVDAGVIPGDTGEHVRSVTYLAAVLDRTQPHALVVQVEDVS